MDPDAVPTDPLQDPGTVRAPLGWLQAQLSEAERTGFESLVVSLTSCVTLGLLPLRGWVTVIVYHVVLVLELGLDLLHSVWLRQVCVQARILSLTALF